MPKYEPFVTVRPVEIPTLADPSTYELPDGILAAIQAVAAYARGDSSGALAVGYQLVRAIASSPGRDGKCMLGAVKAFVEQFPPAVLAHVDAPPAVPAGEDVEGSYERDVVFYQALPVVDALAAAANILGRPGGGLVQGSASPSP